MNVREKLVELVNDVLMYLPWGEIQKDTAERIVDRMLDHDVTVQEWISVDDRLPEPKENAICINRHGDMMIGTCTEWGWMFPCYFESPTHWMPMPQPPKGE